jgi:hypothetical protein
MTTWRTAVECTEEIGKPSYAHASRNSGARAERSTTRMQKYRLFSARFAIILFLIFISASCTTERFGAVYPPRPNASPSPPVADPTPSRIVMHIAVTSEALSAALEDTIPRDGQGDFTLLGGQRHYTWERGPLELSFDQGRLVLDTKVLAHVDVKVTTADLPFTLHVVTEPVINTEYAMKLQSNDVKVKSDDRRLKFAEAAAGALDLIADQIQGKVKSFAYDLKPSVSDAYARVAKPIDVPVGDAHGCAMLKVLGVEAGPTVVADGIEKELAIVVAPSITIPCAEQGDPAPLPPLSNVATVQPGPFTVTIPVAASYAELQKAMNLMFTNGKYFFSPEYPDLYMEKPELYESEGLLVLKLHIAGPIHKFGIDADLNGDLFLSGHIAVIDNELSIPDLEPTIETKNFFLSIKAAADSATIRDQARSALRLDLSDRLQSVRQKLSNDLTFANDTACFKGDVDKIEVTGAYAHGTYARIYVAVTAHANVRAPCAN